MTFTQKDQLIQELNVKIEVLQVSEEKYAIEFYKKSGDFCDFKKLMADVRDYLGGLQPVPDSA